MMTFSDTIFVTHVHSWSGRPVTTWAIPAVGRPGAWEAHGKRSLREKGSSEAPPRGVAGFTVTDCVGVFFGLPGE